MGHPCHGRKEQTDLPSSFIPNFKREFGFTDADLREGPESGGLCRCPLVFPHEYSRWYVDSLLAAVIPKWLMCLCYLTGSGFSLREEKCYSAERRGPYLGRLEN